MKAEVSKEEFFLAYLVNKNHTKDSLELLCIVLMEIAWFVIFIMITFV